jgi:NAD(P)-dependent dehydrogenase (short-subunit alcohol dehydrogenase family)
MQYTPPTDPRGIDLAGKTVLLTGATSGLGYEAAIKFLNLGVDSLVIGSRSLERGYRTKAELEKVTSRPGVVQVWELEMNNFQSVKDFTSRVNKELPRLDIALLNAGLWNREYMLSPTSRWEETLMVNTFATSLLSLLLLPKLRESSGVESTHLSVVSSQQFVRVKAENLTEGALLEHLNSQDRFQGPKQYGISKLLLEYVMKTVADLVRNEDGTLPIIVNTISPGLCQSSLTRQYRRRFYERWLSWLAYRLFARTTEQGSRSLVSATLQGVESQGKCWRSDGYLE